MTSFHQNSISIKNARIELFVKAFLVLVWPILIFLGLANPSHDTLSHISTWAAYAYNVEKYSDMTYWLHNLGWGQPSTFVELQSISAPVVVILFVQKIIFGKISLILTFCIYVIFWNVIGIWSLQGIFNALNLRNIQTRVLGFSIFLLTLNPTFQLDFKFRIPLIFILYINIMIGIYFRKRNIETMLGFMIVILLTTWNIVTYAIPVILLFSFITFILFYCFQYRQLLHKSAHNKSKRVVSISLICITIGLGIILLSYVTKIRQDFALVVPSGRDPISFVSGNSKQDILYGGFTGYKKWMQILGPYSTTPDFSLHIPIILIALLPVAFWGSLSLAKDVLMKMISLLSVFFVSLLVTLPNTSLISIINHGPIRFVRHWSYFSVLSWVILVLLVLVSLEFVSDKKNTHVDALVKLATMGSFSLSLIQCFFVVKNRNQFLITAITVLCCAVFQLIYPVYASTYVAFCSFVLLVINLTVSCNSSFVSPSIPILERSKAGAVIYRDDRIPPDYVASLQASSATYQTLNLLFASDSCTNRFRQDYFMKTLYLSGRIEFGEGSKLKNCEPKKVRGEVKLSQDSFEIIEESRQIVLKWHDANVVNTQIEYQNPILSEDYWGITEIRGAVILKKTPFPILFITSKNGLARFEVSNWYRDLVRLNFVFQLSGWAISLYILRRNARTIL